MTESILLHFDTDPHWSNVKLLIHANGTNGSTTFVDSSGTNVLTAVGSAQISTAQSKFNGSSMYLDGSSSTGLTLPHSYSLYLSNHDFTIEFWTYLTAYPVSSTWAPFYATSGYGDITIGLTGSGQLNVGYSTAGSSWDVNNIGSVIPLNTWVHVAVVRSGTNLYYYINGIQTIISTALGTSYLYDTSSGRYIGSVASSYNLSGYLEDFRITNGSARYTSNFISPTTVLVDATTFLDATGANTITPYGSVQLDPFHSKFNKGSVSFNGTTDFLSVPDNSSFQFGTGDFFIGGWIYLTSYNTATGCCPILISNQARLSLADDSLDIFINTTGIPSGSVIDSSHTLSSVSGSTPLSLNTWHYLAMYRVSGVLHFIIDDVSQGSTSATGSINVVSGGILTLGGGYYNYNTAYSINGYLDEWQVVKGSSGTQASIPSAPINYLIVGGGGAGGDGSGGGGGGGFQNDYTIVPLDVSIPVTVGSGGIAGGGGSNGGNSSVGTIVAYGGQSGDFIGTSPVGSGAGGNSAPGPAGTGTLGQGTSGGVGVAGLSNGGGGGAGGIGGNGSGSTGGAGGVGLQSLITGTLTYYAGGGGASAGTTGGSSSLGGGGSGGNGSAVGTAGTNGLGGGDGGGVPGSNGGSGTVIISVPSYYTVSTTGTVTTSSDGEGNNVYTWTTNGSFIISTGPTVSASYLVAAGGGGGGQEMIDIYPGGGGGAGGVLTGITSLPTGVNIPIIVGVGGSSGTSGTNSSLMNIVTFGGEYGIGPVAPKVSNGGSGGGGYYYPDTVGIPGVGIAGQGYAGGYPSYGGNAPGYGSGGGGGAGGPASILWSAGYQSGQGGLPLMSSITGISTPYGQGGSGGAYTGSIPTNSGLGGGNGSASGVGGNATSYGSGGGGGGGNNIGSLGGSGANGVVIVSLPPGYTATTTGSVTSTSDGLGNTVYTWTANGSMNIVSGPTLPIEYLVVAGGGGGGSDGGGGGAGGLLTGSTTAPLYSLLPVIVGNGGTQYTNGGNSSFNSLIAIGGGHGGDQVQGSGGPAVGGSGGGGNGSYYYPGAAGTPGQGNYGGSGGSGYNGGGGGAGGPGINGNAGPGVQLSISGTPTYYAGGGQGTPTGTATPGGGVWAVTSPVNIGAGGGAAEGGGSGVVIISYPTSYGLSNVTGPFTLSTVGSNYVYTFTGNGTIEFGVTPTITANYLVVGGGGGADIGQYNVVYSCPGAGGVALSGSHTFTVGATSTIVVGNGGTAGGYGAGLVGGAGGSSSIDSIVIATGGNGSTQSYLSASNAAYSGGTGLYSIGGYDTGGAAGAGGNGSNAPDNINGGNGGPGIQSSITGVSAYYGSGGAGNGSSSTGSTTGGIYGTGGTHGIQTAGSQGIVILSYPIYYGYSSTTGPVTQTLDGAGNYVYTFTGNGTIDFGVPPSAPVISIYPVISGTTTVGQTITSNTGTWLNSPTSYTYQWQQDGTTNISGATSSSYTILASDIGHTLNCVVTATDSIGNTSASTSSTPTIIVPSGDIEITYLVVAGGGSGGANGGGGGGGGGVLSGVAVYPMSSTQIITVGAGAIDSGNSTPTDGGNSSIGSIIALGGGGGASRDYGGLAHIGGSGGGGAGSTNLYGGVQNGAATAAAGTIGQGHAGGNGTPPDYDLQAAGGGGGGAGSAGTAASYNTAGSGGNGVSSSITGTATYYGGGGTGGCTGSGIVGTNGLGGGSSSYGGGGQGGATPTETGGGQGIVVISYPLSAGNFITTGSTTMATVGSNRVYTWTSSGTITFDNPVSVALSGVSATSSHGSALLPGQVSECTISYSRLNFNENSNGSITQTSIITLTGTSFEAAIGTDLRARVTNIPTGLTASLIINSLTTATLSFSGTIANTYDPVSNITVTFLNSDFAMYLGGYVSPVGEITSNISLIPYIGTDHLEYLVVAGGGSGGGAGSYFGAGGGGGGGGGVITGSIGTYLDITFNVVVGAGAPTNGILSGLTGSPSSFGSFTTLGGGGGNANGRAPALSNGATGGGGFGVNGSANSGYLFSGGRGGANQCGGGGAGADGNGFPGGGGSTYDTGNGGGGGIGFASSITGPVTYYGGGGGGGANYGYSGNGGGYGSVYNSGGTPITNGGGGFGDSREFTAFGHNINGLPNTGGGGGGGQAAGGDGSFGGSGVVIVSYPASEGLAVTTGACTYKLVGGKYVYTFTSSGTFYVAGSKYYVDYTKIVRVLY